MKNFISKFEKKTITFDLDGTLYDLYNLPNWLPMIENEQPEVFTEGSDYVNIEDLKVLIADLQNLGWTVGITTWLPMKATEEYQRACEFAKKNWLTKKGLDNLQFYNFVPYGTEKRNCLPFVGELNVLVDDNTDILASWRMNKHYKTIAVEKGDTLIEDIRRKLIPHVG